MCPESSIKQIFDLGLESIEDLIKSKMQKIADDNGISMWVCIECQYTSKYTTAMYKHIERMHLNIALKCDYCSREFKSRNDLNVHVKTSHFCTWEHTLFIIEQNRSFSIIHCPFSPFACSVCNLTCLDVTVDVLMEMSKTADGWICNECNFVSKYKDRVWEHVESKHMNFGGYNCQICFKFCPTASSLRNHNDRHHKKK